jgi:hypothetical protein
MRHVSVREEIAGGPCKSLVGIGGGREERSMIPFACTRARIWRYKVWIHPISFRVCLHLPSHPPRLAEGKEEDLQGVHPRYKRCSMCRFRKRSPPAPAEGIYPSTPVAEAEGKNEEGFRLAACASALVSCTRGSGDSRYGSIRSISNFSFLHRPPRRIAGRRQN